MVERGRGHVLNTASAGGLMPIPGMGAYSAVKHAVVGLTETLAAELAELGPGVGATVLCPGLVATDLVRSSSETAPQAVAAQAAAGSGAQPTTPTSDLVLDADTVATLSLAGIEAGALHVITSPDTVAFIRGRLDSVAADLPA